MSVRRGRWAAAAMVTPPDLMLSYASLCKSGAGVVLEKVHPPQSPVAVQGYRRTCVARKPRTARLLQGVQRCGIALQVGVAVGPPRPLCCKLAVQAFFREPGSE